VARIVQLVSNKVGSNLPQSRRRHITIKVEGSYSIEQIRIVLSAQAHNISVGGELGTINPAGVLINGSMVLINTRGHLYNGSPGMIVPPQAP
jgi:hypothetical protein